MSLRDVGQLESQAESSAQPTRAAHGHKLLADGPGSSQGSSDSVSQPAASGPMTQAPTGAGSTSNGPKALGTAQLSLLWHPQHEQRCSRQCQTPPATALGNQYFGQIPSQFLENKQREEQRTRSKSCWCDLGERVEEKTRGPGPCPPVLLLPVGFTSAMDSPLSGLRSAICTEAHSQPAA